MPTKEEFQELLDNCTWERTTQNETLGYIVTGPNGQSIFLPVAGFHAGAMGCSRDREIGKYWSSSPGERDRQGATAYCLCLAKVGYVGVDTHYEYEQRVGTGLCDCGSSVRPVLAD